MSDYASTDEGAAPPKGKEAQDILQEARDRFQYSESIDSENRKNARSDTEFVWVKGKQWPDGIRQERELADRPWLEINQLPQFINQVVNDQRQGRPGIRVYGASGDASEDTAEVLQGMVRHIEYDSNAEAAYDSGFASAVTGGRGYWRIVSDYVDDKSFDQKLCIKRIPDPDSVRMDPDYQDPDGGDIKWCFVTELVSKDDFQKRWPKADAVSWSPGAQDGTATWYEGANKIVVADYYRCVETKRTLVVMTDGTVGWKDELPKDLPEGIEIVREREACDYAVEWYKIAGGEQVLETYEWPGKCIPVIMCVGDEIMVNGKRIFQGLIRRARDPQTMYNYWKTSETEFLALAPRPRYVAAFAQVEGFQNDWQAMNRSNNPVLYYNPKSEAGNLVPPPQYQAFAGVPAGFVEAANEAKADLRATTGIYDPSLGQRSNETSGRAILAREKQGDTATYHYVDNLSRAIALTGRILVDLIPHYYDTQRIVTTIGEEDDKKLVTVNERMVNPMDVTQAIVRNDLSVGSYAVTVDAGPSYQTKRQEAADSMMQFIQAYPPAAQIAGDLIAKNMDWPGAEQIANRLKLLLPPQIQQSEQEGAPQLPPQVQQQIAQMQQQLQAAGQAVKQLQAENQQLKSGVVEKQQIAQMEDQRKREEFDAENARKRAEAIAAGQTEEEVARIRSAAQVAVARIAEQTKLEVAEIQMPTLPDPAVTAEATGIDPQQQLAQAMLELAGNLAHHARIASAPRRSSFIFDEHGNPVGSESMPVLQ